MAATNKHFKLARTTKRIMETIIDPAARHEFKRAMIDAQLAYDKAGQDGQKGWQEEKKAKKEKRNRSQIAANA